MEEHSLRIDEAFPTTEQVMDITTFVTKNRERAFLVGDYNTYRSQVTRQLLSLKRRLGRTTPKNAKYAAKAPVTASDISKNHEYAMCIWIRETR